MGKKLNEILATEKGLRQRVNEGYSALHHSSAKSELFEGHIKTYQPIADNDDPKAQKPENRKVVQLKYGDVLKQTRGFLVELFDFAAARDWSNCEAKADVVVDGIILCTQVPVTYLLFLDKQLANLIKFVSSLAELDPSVPWTYNDATGYRHSDVVRTQSTEKVTEPVTIAKATREHPEQAQLVTKDVVVGYWETVRQSGAIPRPEKLAIVERAQKLKDACLQARAIANTVVAKEKKVGDALFGYLLG